MNGADGYGKEAAFPLISVVIPAYNEEKRLPAHLESITDYFRLKKHQYEIIVVDDGSTDSTAALVEAAAALNPRLKLLRLPGNRGKGHAVKAGMLAAQGTLRLFTDADGSTPISELERLAAAIAEGADIAIASRASHDASRTVQCKLHRKILGTIFNLIARTVAVKGFADTQCGFKLFTGKAADSIFPLQRIDGFGFDVEVLYIGQKQKLEITEVPVNWCDVAGSKVNLLSDSCKMFRDLFTVRCFDTLRLYASAKEIKAADLGVLSE